ncbi:hypothetical protein [Dictyobacter kobayashii]|nr:hypothetical protein [Dictyobacter kobayashii]
MPGYKAMPGWDAVTGWGTPIVSALVPLLAHLAGTHLAVLEDFSALL